MPDRCQHKCDDPAMLTLDERIDMDNARFKRARDLRATKPRELGAFEWPEEDEDE